MNRISFTGIIVLIFIICMAFSSQITLAADPIPVLNPSFEEPAVTYSTWNWNNQDSSGQNVITGWNYDYTAGAWPSDNDTGTWAGVVPTDGTRMAFVRHSTGAAANQVTGPWQDLGYTIVAGQTYLFTMDVQRRQDGTAGSLTFNYHDAGTRTEIIENLFDMAAQAEDEWLTYSVSFTAVAGEACIGMSLGIEFNNESGIDSWQHFDNAGVIFSIDDTDPNCCYPFLSADFDNNCVVNLNDLSILAENWLMEFQEDFRDISDFSQLSSQWLEQSEQVPAELCDLYLVGYDDCGVPGAQPNLLQGNDWTYPESVIPFSMVPADSAARTVSFHDTEVIYRYEGLKPTEAYKARITFLCDVGNRNLNLLCDTTTLLQNLALPYGIPITRIIEIPSASYQDEQIELKVTKNAGANAVVSEIELWSSDPLLAVLRIQVTGLLDNRIEIFVTDSKSDAVDGADLTIAVQDTALSEAGTTGQNGRFIFTIPESWEQHSDKDLIITAQKDDATGTIYTPMQNYILKLPRLTPRPQTVVGVADGKVDLTGTWHFNTTPDPDFWEIASFPPAGWSTIEVPGEWVMQGFTVADNQAAGYLREYTIPSDWLGRRIKLRCDAVYSDADVYINGQVAGSHTGGFTPFELDVTDIVNVGATNTIALAVTNESLADTMASGTQYAAHKLGGISRKLYLFAVPELNLSALHITTDLDENYQDATLHLYAKVINEGSVSADTAQLDISLEDPDGQVVTIVPDNISLPSVGVDLSIVEHIEIPVTAPSKWDCEHPNLYTLTCTLSDGQGGQETIVQKIGFREVEVRGNQLYVNDHPVKLRGVCRHEVHPLRGRSLTDEFWQMDAELFRNGNCNFIRTSHYPPAEEFLAACDELGLFVEDEAPFCWEKGSNDDTHKDLTITQTLEMVERDRNHPSVLFWSLANESDWGNNFQASSEQVRMADPSRPQIFSYGEVDLTSWHYPGPDGPADAANQPKPTIFDEFCHLNCYNRREILTDPGVRDDWGRGFAPMWENMLISQGCLGGSIWAAIDDAFHLPSGSEVGYGYWGPIDAWRRPKPEYWHMKKSYSPIRITPTTLAVPPTGSIVEIPVSNRFDFTNLNELTINWSVDGNSGTAVANIAPRNSGTLSIDTGITELEGKVLDVEFQSHLGYLVDHYKLQIGQTNPPQPPSMSGSAQYALAGGIYTITAGDAQWKIDQTTGLIIEGKKNSQLIVKGGPHLMLLSLMIGEGAGTQMAGTVYQPHTDTCSNWMASSVLVTMDGNFVKVDVIGEYDQASGSYTMRFDGTGQMSLDYNFTSKIDVDPRQTGIVLDVDTSFDTLQWLRAGQWTTYPDDHIGRLAGQTQLYGSGGTYVPLAHGIEPMCLWSDDMAELGTNDFRSTKRSIYEASLKNSVGTGLDIYSDGSQHTRSYKEADRIRILIANFATGGDDFFFRSHYASERSPIYVDDTISDTIHVQIVETTP
jgi:beta-galactosidase